MRAVIRLYRVHDIDLLYLSKLPDFSLRKNIKDAIRNYLNYKTKGTPLKNIEVPYIDRDIPIPSVLQIQIYLSESADADIIEWLNNIPAGYRNCALKCIFRSYLKLPPMVPFEVPGYVSNNLFVKIPRKVKENKGKIQKENIATNILSKESKTKNVASNMTEAAPILQQKKKDQENANEKYRPIISKEEDDTINSTSSYFNDDDEEKPGIDPDELTDALSRMASPF